MMDDFRTDVRVLEIGRPDRHRIGTCEQKFKNIFGRLDASHADDRKDVCFLTSCTIRIATGLIAGPDNPPVLLAIIGFFVFKSIFIPVSVLIIVNPSAPAASIALAIWTMSVTFGDSFT